MRDMQPNYDGTVGYVKNIEDACHKMYKYDICIKRSKTGFKSGVMRMNKRDKILCEVRIMMNLYHFQLNR